MPTNKEAARVLAHPNGQRCELTQILNHILLHAVRFGKVCRNMYGWTGQGRDKRIPATALARQIC